MVIIKYRTNGDKVNEIAVDSNITVSSFIELVNKDSDEKVSKSIFRGKILEDNDLIRNHITGPDQVLTLLTKDNDMSNDVIDLENEVNENKKKKEVEHSVSSSFLLRQENKKKRRGFRFTFTVYTTANSDSMLKGNKLDFSLSDDYTKIHDEIKKLVSSFPQVNYVFDLYIFLPGGVPFKSEALLEYYIDPDDIAYDNIYAIVVQKSEDPYDIDETIDNPCSCCDKQAKEILSPICTSSSAGLTQISSFLGYMYYGGPKSEHILLSLAKVTRFAPLVVNLFRLIENRPLNILNILSITAPLYTLFRSMLPNQVKDENVFEYTLNFLSIFDVITNTEYLKFLEIDQVNEKDCEKVKQLSEYFKKTDQQKHVIIWTADTINPDFEAVLMNPEFSTIENIFSTITTFKPVAPLSLHYIFYPTFIRGVEEKSVMLFIKEVQDKEGFISIINPEEGAIKEIKIETLANEINCNKKDDVFALIDPNQVDQINFICFDESNSMKWKLDGGNAHHNEKIRSVIATDFLKALVKQSYALRVSSFYGLISFSSEVKIRQPLTAMSSEFIQSLSEIKPHGKTLLYDAINLAQQQICKLVKDNDGNSRYPNARLRIIVITDGSDNKSEKAPESLINDLIQNEIVVDSVLVSLVDKSAGCCAISKLTGGLCFMPKSFEEGIEIFQQEAFLNIKIRHMNSLPYSKITSEIFADEKEFFDSSNHYDSYAPNQMIISAKMKASLATPRYMSYISTQKRIKTYRIMRSFTELNIISRNQSDSYIVYSLHATPEEWSIFIKGPKNTPFNNKWLNLYMVISSNYPADPPKFRFLTIPFHPNISSEGTVVFSLNDRNYTYSLGIDSIINGIIDLLENPDVNYSINQKAMELFKNNIKEFEKLQKEGEIGCDDYHEYLQDVKIYDEVPVDAVVPNEDRSKSNLISLTRVAVNKAAEKGSEVTEHCLLDINDYQVIKKLGSGGFGDVYLIEEKITHYKFAAKVPKNSNDDEEQVINYVKEVNVISIFSHGAIAKLYGYFLNDFDGNDKCVIVMEYVPNDDLRKIIDEEKKGKPRKGWDKTQKLINIYGIASGMAYSVSYGIKHSDLKPENILMTNVLNPKITDFDSARLESEENTQSFVATDNEIASPQYTAPEVIEAEEGYRSYAEQSDVYSFAIMVYEIVTALPPYDESKSVMKLYREVVKGKRPEIPYGIPSQYKRLIKECWDGNPDERPTFKEIVEKLKTDEFTKDDDIDKKRFQKYVDYLDNYKSAVTESKFIRPKSQADKNKFTKSQYNSIKAFKAKNINILNLKDYVKEDQIGAGKFSQVVRIKQKNTGKVFAAKISLQSVSEKVNEDILSEVNIMKNLNYPSILKFVGYSPVNFENESKPTIVTEFSSKGSLQNIIEDKSSYPEFNDTKKLIIIFGIIAGMLYLHEHSILHNDLKPSNVLLDDNFYPKISDFGLSHTNANSDSDLTSSSNIKGTPCYIAPEIWNDKKYNEASDVYSFGILLYEIVYMKKAFAGMKHFQIAYKVTNKERPPFPNLKEASVFKPLIKRCWADDPKDRPTFKELMTELQDRKYFTKTINMTEYNNYVKLIKDFK